MSLVKHTLIPDRLKCPPLRFNIVVVVCNIWILHVSPEANTLTHLFPLIFIFPNRFLTLLDKRLDSISLNLRLTVNSEHLLYFKLYRKTMSIPASLKRNILSLHCMVSWNNVLYNSSLNMTNMWHSICSWRTIK